MYKKYIYKNGKKIGPYYYESKRVGNRIKTVYLGSKPIKVALQEKKFNHLFLISLLIFLSLIGLFFIRNYTGFSTFNSYSEQLNLEINQSQSYAWNVQNPGDLSSLKISGLIVGTGKVKISIQNNNLTYLIFDSSSSNLLTGAVIESDIYSIVDTSKKNKTKEKTVENITQLPQNLSENITLENISVSEAIDTSKQENLTLTNKSEISQSNLNLTENASVSSFKNACIETCSLTNFSSENYTLVFELDNATVVLDNIEYSANIPKPAQNLSISPNLTGNIALENLTQNITLENITVENLTLNNIANISIENLTNITISENLANLTIQNLTLENITLENLANLTIELPENITSKNISVLNLSKFEIKDSKKQKLNYKVIKQEKDSLEIEIHGKNIKSMKFEGVRNLTELYLEELPENEIKDKKFKKIYAVNPALLDFDNATLTIKATGNELYKCKDWNFTEQKCYGSWQSLRYITPNLDYVLTITKEDPAFGEIEISNATHLDSSYNFISNIYDQVKSKDNIWSEPIYTGQYVRVTFVQNLTNGNDITLYARNLYGAETTIEVYLENSNEKITEFPLINIEDYYQIIFENLTDSSSTFDLKIKSNDSNAYLEFDHIIDPINSVTLDDPTNGNRVVWSSQWFYMNCTVAKQGGPDTPQYLYFEHNNTDVTMRKIPVNLATSTLNTSSTNPISSFSYATMYSVNVSTPNANNYQIRCIANNTAGTTVTSVVRKITVLQTNVTFNMSSLSLGTANQNEQPLMSSAIVFSNGTNNNVNISCLTGSCSTITTNFSSVNLLDNGTKTAFFNCSTSTLGFFSANFTVNSTQYQNSTLTDTKQLNVSCSIIDPLPFATSVEKNQSTIITGSWVNFSANWTDNAGLSGYIFTWNNSGSWINSSFSLFSGNGVSQNISNVTASTNTYVCWKFYANDSLNGWNMTMPNNCFTVSITPVSYCSGNFNNSKTAFNINSNIECANETMDINGNITIASGGNLTLKNITIRFTGATANGYNYINKTENAGLWIYDNDNNQSTSNDASNISSATTYSYNFWAFGNGNNDNFTLKNSIVSDAGYFTGGSLGIKLSNISNIIISGNNITKFSVSAYGFNLVSSDKNNITNNYINASNGNYGIAIDSSSDNNTIENNSVGDSAVTDISAAGSSNKIINNTIYGTYKQSFQYGISISGNYNIMANNTVYNREGQGGGSIAAVSISGSNNNITGNLIYNNTCNTCGEWLSAVLITGSNTYFSNNRVYNNTPDGIALKNAYGNLIENNQIWNNSQNNLNLGFDSSDGNATHNIIKSNTMNNSASNIYIIGATNKKSYNNTIISNNLTNSRSHGIDIQADSENNTIYNNRILDSGDAANEYGINTPVGVGDNNNISSNLINNSFSDGILIASGNNYIIMNNTISFSGGDGIDITTSSNNIMSNNLIYNNTLTGISIGSTSANQSILSNTIKDNTQYNIYISSGNTNSFNNTIKNNVINNSGSGYDNIYIKGTILGSTVCCMAIDSNNITFAGRYGIFISAYNSLNISNNIISTNITNTDNIYIDLSNDNIIQNNNLKFSARDGIRIGNFSAGISSSNNTIKNNNITNATNGISIFMNATRPFKINNTIENNNITFTTNAIYIQNSSNINISLGIIRNSTNGIVLFNSKQVNATNITFTSNTYDFNITNSSSLTSINNTFNKTVKVLDLSNLTISWFLNVNITDNSSKIINNANVTSYDNSTGSLNQLSYTKQTGINGLTGNVIVIEYLKNSTANQTLYTPYNVTAKANSSYQFNSTLEYLGNSKIIILSLSYIPPTTYCSGNFNNTQNAFVISTDITCSNETMDINGNITIASGGNLTLKNVTIRFTGASADGDNYINKTENAGLWIYDNDNNQSTSNDASYISSSTAYYYDFWAWGNGLRDNFTIQNSKVSGAGYSILGSQGIQLYNISNATVSGNNISDTKEYGLFLRNSSNNNLTNNTITIDNTPGDLGIRLSTSSNLIIQGNTITTTTSNGYGIYLLSILNSNITSNTITTSGSFGYGIWLSSSSNSTIQGNNITTSGFSDGYGIYLLTSSNSNTLTSNIITTNGDSLGYGIYLDTSSNSNISSNTITVSSTVGGSPSIGIYLISSSTSNTLQNNTITTSGTNSYGISLSSSSNSTLQSNNITTSGSTGHGIYLLTSSNSTLQSNNITTSGSSGNGIYLLTSSNSNITSNTITTNGGTGYGIYLDTSSNSNTLTSNTITTNGSSGYGIYLLTNSNSNITSNIITTNDTLSYGIYLLASDLNNLSSNTINSSNSDSIFINSNSSNNTISSNTLKFSKYSGIRIQNSTTGIMPQNNTIQNNNITNATNGISIFMNTTRPFAVNHTIENNNITFTTNAIYIQNSSNINISLGIIRNSTNGVVLFNSKQVNATNITFTSNTYDFNITNSSALTSINNSFSKSKVAIGSQSVTQYSATQLWNTSNLDDPLYSEGTFDYNRKGKNNFTVFGGNGSVYAFYPNGTQLWNYTFSNSATAYVYDIEVFNNGSGFNDTIAIINYVGSANGSLIILDKDGNKLCNSSDLTPDVYSMATGDFNEDGNKSEIVVGRTSGIGINAFYSNCTQIWSAAISGSGSVYEIETGDLDNDGYYDDIAAISESAGVSTLDVYNGSGINKWNLSTPLLGDSKSIEIANFDGKAGDDIVVSDPNAASSVYAYNGTGSNLWNFTDPTNNIFEIRFGNFSNNGIIAFVDTGQDVLYVLNASGSQSWNASVGADLTYSLAVGDLDNDGKDDIVVGGLDSKVLMFNNSGSNLWNYTTGGDIGSGYADGGLEIADIDGDGQNDVIAASRDKFGYVLTTTNSTTTNGDLSNFTIMWFAEVYINDNQANTNVSVWNTTNVLHYNTTTNSNGLTNLFLLTEYTRNNTDNLTSNNPFNFTASNTTFFNSSSQNIDQSKRVTISFLAAGGVVNTAPTVNNLTLTPLFPNTTINLNCSFIITDPNADTLTVNLTWYKNSTINKTYTGISVTNGTVNQHYLQNANTSKNDNWSCGVRPYDQTAWGNEVNSSVVTIQNSQPSTPSLTSPADGNKTTNRTETFYWAQSTDPDNDPITYTINISCWNGCSTDNRLVNTTSINYTPSELKYFLDDNYYYNWTVKAIDSDANSSSYAVERNLSIASLVSLTLPNSTVLFGTRSLGDIFNTVNNTPSPIVIQNDGNSYVNVNLSAQSMLFTTLPNPSTNYQYKIDNTTIEAGSFNYTGSVTSWTNIPNQNNTAINLFNYSTLNDTAEMDIQITVPLDEPPGNLTSNLILTGYYIAYYP